MANGLHSRCRLRIVVRQCEPGIPAARGGDATGRPGYRGGRQHTGVDGGSHGAAGSRRDPGGNPVRDGKQVGGVHAGEVPAVHGLGYVTAELRGS